MQKVMSYVDGQIDYTIRYRYLLVHIIEMIPEVKELEIEFRIQDNLDFSSWFEYQSGSFKTGLKLNDGFVIDQDLVFQYTLKVKKLEQYFTMFNINDYDYRNAVWIFVTLHELGHIHYFNKFKHVYEQISEVNDFYKLQIKEAISPVNAYEIMDSYFCSAGELFADQFAYKYFPYVWNNLKNMNLV